MRQVLISQYLAQAIDLQLLSIQHSHFTRKLECYRKPRACVEVPDKLRIRSRCWTCTITAAVVIDRKDGLESFTNFDLARDDLLSVYLNSWRGNNMVEEDVTCSLKLIWHISTDGSRMTAVSRCERRCNARLKNSTAVTNRSVICRVR